MKPRPSRYNGAILKKLAVFLRKAELFHIQLGRNKEEEHLRCVEALLKLCGSFAKAGWSSGVWETGRGVRRMGCG